MKWSLPVGIGGADAETAIARGVATAAGLDRNTAVSSDVDLALQRPNSRQDEFEADRRGPRF